MGYDMRSGSKTHVGGGGRRYVRLIPMGQVIHHAHFTQENEDSKGSKVTCLRFYSEE